MWLILLVGKYLSRVFYVPSFELCPGTPGQPTPRHSLEGMCDYKSRGGLTHEAYLSLF